MRKNDIIIFFRSHRNAYKGTKEENNKINYFV